MVMMVTMFDIDGLDGWMDGIMLFGHMASLSNVFS
jgi:hypothetical protein